MAVSVELYTMKEVCGLLKKSRTTLWRWIRSGHFPQPLKIGPNSLVWTEDQVTQWIESKF
jgi:prophage regulatory protein